MSARDVRKVVGIEAEHQLLDFLPVIVIVSGYLHFEGVEVGHTGMSLLLHHLQIAINHCEKVDGVDFFSVIPHLHVEQVAADGQHAPCLYLCPERSHCPCQVGISHFILAVPGHLEQPLPGGAPDSRHHAVGHCGQYVPMRTEIHAVVEKRLAALRMGLFPIAQEHLHFAVPFLKRHTVAACGNKVHFLCIVHILVIVNFLSVLSSHSSLAFLALLRRLPYGMRLLNP